MRLILIPLLFFCSICIAQNNYPQDYFSNPLEIPLILAGNFAEFRSNHFHSGLDIKTQQREGLKILAAADGFVSRIKISHFGYGKALYITHPNGYTTVYAHLQNFNPEIEAYIKKQQYKQESYEIELFPQAGELQYSKGAVVAYSGNTGGSGGPHLHFEIRDKEENALNPLLFGFDIADSVKPVVSNLYVYAFEDSSHVNKSGLKQKLRLIPLQNGDYMTETIEGFGKIGFAIGTTDRQNLAANNNGVYNIQTFFNGNKNFEIDFKEFSFDESKHINRLIDYDIFKTKKHRVQKLFIDNNPLSLFESALNNGFIKIDDSTNSVYKIKVTDYKNNDTWVTINIKGKKSDVFEKTQPETTPYYIYANQTTNLKEGNVSVDIYPNTFYEDLYINFQVRNDTLMLHKDIIPLQKSITISFDVSKYSDEDKNKLYIAELLGYKKYPSYSMTKRKENTLYTYTKTLGTYALTTDNKKPTISAINFQNGQWLSNFRYLKIKIDDDLSGISNFRATVNGKWILMEYEYKTKTLTYDFNDGIITDTKNNLKIIVTDNVGNSSTFETMFYRK
ncbi:MAG: M23 family metallopeptidase [Flavobacteriaceae bacterium]|nr:M23 family metallopeptidase [Flavobacteriaceae bacterium]